MIVLLSALLLASANLQGAALEKSAKSRSAEVIISSDKALAAGSSRLHLKIKLKNNHSGIKEVEVKAFMPAMPGMPAMESRSVAKALGDNNYEATVNLSMSGTWQLHIFITPNEGKKIRAKSSVNVN